jgi:molybdopterin synthase catalytic subunit
MIKVKFFAALRETIGQGEVELEASSERPMTVNSLITELEVSYPNLGTTLKENNAAAAVNHEFAGPDSPVGDGDEVAFIPPMSGGSGAADYLVRIQREDFSVDKEVARVKQTSTSIGGIDIFLGTARDISLDRKIGGLEFEHYPGMAEKQLRGIRTEALDRFDVIEIGIVHRYGAIAVGENIVLVIAAARHRVDAFEACRWCIDELKRTAPIWKKEFSEDGRFWVEEHP